MDTVIYDINEIVRVDGSGIKCVDGSGETRFIDLKQCRDNWMKTHSTGNGNHNCVADRDSSAPLMYYLFYSEPRVKVAFSYRKSSLDRLLRRTAGRSEKDLKIFRNFNEFCKKIEKAGWNVCDVS